ncbi:hypothetical protein DSCW_25810 [Desulfosarcina widdelii]|uniref:DUF11 domain-containing protein n=1 Tax=Desulfosarcina widdelii TaxID=947919 RepID=A0A5K7Z9L4_9BACT|nr:DUF11 domain-containing protein [Desulfosarcina widdelii]BBO75164.1 hypothetical protein DSCW_25810 [Desulfosarcina widdelii]
MKTRKQKSWNSPIKKLAWVFAAALMMLNAQQAMASTAENTTITNTVTVTYEDAQGAAMEAITATATVTVALVEAAPTITSPADIDPTNENTASTLIYTVTGNANGDDSYTITFALVNTDIGAVTVADVPVTLGGTTLAAAASATETQIIVPYDSNADGDSAATNGIEHDDTIIIGGSAYVVDTVSENSSTNLTTITLTTALSSDVSIGEIVGEQQEINVTVTTDYLDTGATVGTYAVTATITSDSDSSASAAQDPVTMITVRLTQLTVAKYVRDIANDSGTTPSYSYNGITYYTSVSAEPGATLEYIVVVTNDTGAALEATNVVIEDPIPQFTTFLSGTISLDPDIDDSTDPLDTLTDATSDDAGELDGDTVRIRAGSGGTDTVGGTLAEDQTTVGIFRVTID